MVLISVALQDVNLILDQPLLTDITASFETGITCLLGPNGAGKTLTNRILALIEPVSSGSISWDGQIVNPYSEYRIKQLKQVGYMYQQPVFVNKSVRENVELPLKFRKDIELEEKVDKMLLEFELDEIQERHVSKISIGQRQKVALARTMITDPELIILDEPTSSLDMKTTKWFESYLRKLRDTSSKVIVWTTHDHFQVKRVADEVAIILDGMIHTKGTVDDIFAQTENELVKRYLEGELI